MLLLLFFTVIAALAAVIDATDADAGDETNNDDYIRNRIWWACLGFAAKIIFILLAAPYVSQIAREVFGNSNPDVLSTLDVLRGAFDLAATFITIIWLYNFESFPVATVLTIVMIFWNLAAVIGVRTAEIRSYLLCGVILYCAATYAERHNILPYWPNLMIYITGSFFFFNGSQTLCDDVFANQPTAR